MDPNKYQIQALTTETDYEALDDILTQAFYNKEIKPFRALHGAMTICTEAGELMDGIKRGDEPNMIEEIGDICWGIALLCDALKINFVEFMQHKELETGLWGIDVSIHAANILDALKKHLFYGALLDVSRITCEVQKIVWILNYVSDLPDVMEKNIAKLQKRYGAKFTAEKALHRDPKAEMQAMNGGAK